MEFTPLSDRVVVEEVGLDELDETGRIAIPKNIQEQYAQRGIARLVGPSADPDIRPGVGVLLNRHAEGKAFKMEGKKYRAYRSKDIIAIVFKDRIADVQPLRDYVLLDWQEAEPTWKKTGLIKPETSQEYNHTGVVMSVGPDAKFISVGERIVFNRLGDVSKFMEKNKRYAIVKERSIMAVIPQRVAV